MPVRYREALVVGLLCLGVLSVFYFEVLFQNRTFLPFGYPSEVMGPAPPWQFSGKIRINPYRIDSGGSAWQLEPWAKTISTSYKSGQLPLWNAHQFFGSPLAADAQPGAFDILRLPTLLTSHAWGWDLYYLSQSALATLLTYAFARSAGFRPVAAFLAGVAYAFSGFMFIRGNMHYVEIYHLLPAVLWATDQVVRGAVRRGVLGLAGAVALTLFAGMPEATLLTFLYAASYGAFRAGWEAVAQGSWRFALQRNVVLALAWIAGIGIAAPLLVPMFEYVGLSYNIHPPERGLGLLYLPLRTIAYIGVPFIEGIPTRGVVDGSIIPLDDYSGAAVLLLAIVGALSLPRLGGARSVGIFALGSAAIWGAKLYGVPGLQQLGQLPLLVQTLILIWGTPLFSFSLALLAGAGVQALLVGPIGVRSLLVAGCVFVAYLLASTALNWQTLQAVGRLHTLSTVGLAAGAGLLAWLCLAFGQRWSRPVAAVGACLAAIAELAFLAPHDVYSDRYDSLAEPPFVGWLQQQQASQPVRVFSNDGLLHPDYASAFGIDDLRAIDGLYPKRTWDFVHTFLSPSVTDRYVGGFGHPELPTEIFRNKWLNLSNVRYILRPANQSPSDATLAQVIVAAHYPPTDALHVSQFTLDNQRREVLVQRAPGETTFHFRADASQPRLTFFVGLDPNIPTPAQTTFTASIQADGQRHVVFQQVLDGRSDGLRHWLPGNIDLTPYVGQEVDLILRTESSDNSTLAPGWGDVHLTPRPEADQFTCVYDGEVNIWENTQAAPRAFLVGTLQRASSSADAIARMQVPGFDPSTTAVVEDETASLMDLPSGPAIGAVPGSVRITEYRQQQVYLTVDAQQTSLLVLTDTYYPGWVAAVDGVQTPIVATDLAFRGVAVPAGIHQVTFSYAPASFSVGVGVAVVAVVLLGLLIWRTPAICVQMGR